MKIRNMEKTVVFRWGYLLGMLLLVVANLGSTGCARSRLEELSRLKVPYDTNLVEYRIPETAAPMERFVVTDRVEIRTSHGTIVVGLFGNDAPLTVQNFLGYVDTGFYADTVFHRVISGFMIQGGGFDLELERKPTLSGIPLEIVPGLHHVPGTVSMARTRLHESGTSQFFICVGEAVQLNGEYAAFGKVEEGLDVATAISRVSVDTVETASTLLEDVPRDTVVIHSIERL